MIWSIDTDDFHGFCTGKKFGLIRTIRDVLFDYAPLPTAPSTTSTTTEEDHSADYICGDSPGFKPDPESCKMYYHCFRGDNNQWEYHHLSCDDKLLFSKRQSICVWADDTDCDDDNISTSSTTSSTTSSSTTSTSSTTHEICGNSTGLKPDAEDCKWYYNCYKDGNDEWVYYHLPCNENLLFNKKSSICDHAYNVDCNDDDDDDDDEERLARFKCPGAGFYADGTINYTIYIFSTKNVMRIT
jgi:hypothetical protein